MIINWTVADGHQHIVIMRRQMTLVLMMIYI